MKTTVLQIALFIMFSGMVSCRKDKTGPARYTGCRISQVMETNNNGSKSQYIFSYNDDGTVANIMMTDLQSGTGELNKKFIYGKNFVKVGTFESGSIHLSELDSIVLNNQKMVTDIYTNVNQGLQNQQVSHYNYDAAGEIISYTTTTGSNVYQYTYQYLDGDVMQDSTNISEGGGGSYQYGYVYEYDTVLYNTGNMKVVISDLEDYGMPVFTRHHLRKKEYYNSSPYLSYSYSFDGDGKITGITSIYNNSSTATSNTQITYACE